MFRRTTDRTSMSGQASDRVDSVLGSGITWQGVISGAGGVRIDGAFDGDITVHGIVVIGEQGRVTCKQIKAATVVVSGSLKGDVTAYKVEITGSGRVWGDVITTSFSTEEGAFLRGNITMEDQMDLGFVEEPPAESEDDLEDEGKVQEEST